MANGRFSRGIEVIANASMAFVGNIDESIEQLVNSTEHDLFLPLPAALDLAVMDRFCCYLPGWEMPKSSSAYLTDQFGFITDYIAEAFHHLFRHSNRYEHVSNRLRLGAAVEGRDEKGIKKTIAGFLKILHPGGDPTNEEFEEYTRYAVEMRRRVKEQMNKRKPDDEFARIDLSYFRPDGGEVIVFCPESQKAPATLTPSRRQLEPAEASAPEESPIEAQRGGGNATIVRSQPVHPVEAAQEQVLRELEDRHITIRYGDAGHSYESLFGDYLIGAKKVIVEDPYIRLRHQVGNFVRLCELLIRQGTVREISLVTGYDGSNQKAETTESLSELAESLKDEDVLLTLDFNPRLHDRAIKIDNGWVVKIGRGLDIYQPPQSWFELGASDLNLRKCLETSVDIYRKK